MRLQASWLAPCKTQSQLQRFFFSFFLLPDAIPFFLLHHLLFYPHYIINHIAFNLKLYVNSFDFGKLGLYHWEQLPALFESCDASWWMENLGNSHQPPHIDPLFVYFCLFFAFLSLFYAGSMACFYSLQKCYILGCWNFNVSAGYFFNIFLQYSWFSSGISRIHETPLICTPFTGHQ